MEGFLEKETLGQYVKRMCVNVPAHSFRVLLNGFVIPEHLWKGVRPRAGDNIIFQSVVEGGGGGNKILRTIALIVVAILSAYTGGAAGALYFGSFAPAVGAAVMIGGTMLVNALLPVPTASNTATGLEAKEAREQFQIAGGDNPVRLYESMPLVFGRIKVAPDFSTKPYTDLVDKDQYLYQTFNFGLQPDLVLSEFKIGTNAIADYSELSLLLADASGKVSLASNVDTQDGFDVPEKSSWITRTTSPDTSSIQIDFAAQAYSVDGTTGKSYPQNVVFEVEVRPVGAETWTPCGDDILYNTGAVSTHYWSKGFYTLSTEATIGEYGGYGGYGIDGMSGGPVESM